MFGKNKVAVQQISPEILKMLISSRELTTKILWDKLRPDINPLSPKNKLVMATRPITSLANPSINKLS